MSMASKPLEWTRTAEFIDSLNPATSEVLGTVPVFTAEQVAAAAVRARRAQIKWAALPIGDRKEHLLGLSRALARKADALAELLQRETGKPASDCMSEILLALMHLDHAARRAEEVLARRRVPVGFLQHFRAEVTYHPVGVVGVIGPWNYPIATPMGSIAAALAAGNAVVFKPSEFASLIGQLLGEIAAQHLPISSLFEVVTGDGRTGEALARADIDKLSFTGSSETGKKVMAAAASRLTPVVLELGGKDAMIVAADADLDDAAQAAVFGSLSNAGQACVSIERCFVEQSVYQEFVQKVLRQIKNVEWGQGGGDIGPMTTPAQVEVVRAHHEDALARGAQILHGGPALIRGQHVPPTLVVDVTPEMKLMQEETFGPVLPIMRVHSVEEGLEHANALRYGLGAALFGKRSARALAGQVRVGAVSINSVLGFGAIPALPFGGVGWSGFGRIHGDEGLREFSRVQSVATRRFASPLDPLKFGVPPSQVRMMIHQLFGGGAIDRARTVLRKLRP